MPERIRPIRSLKLPKGGLTRFSLRPLIPKLRLTRSQMQTLPRIASSKKLSEPPRNHQPPLLSLPTQPPPWNNRALPQNCRKRHRSPSENRHETTSVPAQSLLPSTPVLRKPVLVFDLLGQEQEIASELERVPAGPPSPTGSRWSQEKARPQPPSSQSIITVSSLAAPEELLRPPLRASNSNSPRRPPPPPPHPKEASSALTGRPSLLRRSGAGSVVPANTSPPDRKRMRAARSAGGTENLPRADHPALAAAAALWPGGTRPGAAALGGSHQARVRH
jgi:hypothetical protein